MFTRTSQFVHMIAATRRECDRVLRRALIAPVALAALAVVCSPAMAAVSTAQTVDGPSPDILELGGVAMAEDGSGGLVYRKRVDGRAHVFVSLLRDGRWGAPQRVDTGQAFDSSWPRIGAGNGGRVVATWVQEFGAGADRLFSASLDPGATRFQAPLPIDSNVGESTATFPSLVMNRGGVAYLAYRVLPDSQPDPNLPPGYVNADIRVARYNGSLWSTLGSPVDRNTAAPVREPTPGNSPKVGIDVTGNGLVAFQEPDDDFIDRVYARRIFGGSVGIPLLVSPQAFGGRPLRGPADAFSLDEAGFGEGAVAFRQQPGEGSTLKGPRVFVSLIPEAFSPEAGKFGEARLADGAGEGAAQGTPGPPSVAVTPRGAFRTTFPLGTASLLVRGDEANVGPAARLDDGTSDVPGDPVVDVAPSGASVAAWKVRSGGRGGVALQEQRSDGVPELRTVTAARGGPVEQLLLSGSGFGDGAAAFVQGGERAAQVAAAIVDAPPTDFVVQTPIGFVRSRRYRLAWDPAVDAIGPVKYRVTVDDEAVTEGQTGTSLGLGARQLGEGRHTVQVVAIDGADQETASEPGEVRVDRRAPRARISGPPGRSVTVRISDGPRREASGPVARSTTIAFGDGRSVRRVTRMRHRYARAGTFRLVVRTRDRAGNRATIRMRVRVR